MLLRPAEPSSRLECGRRLTVVWCMLACSQFRFVGPAGERVLMPIRGSSMDVIARARRGSLDHVLPGLDELIQETDEKLAEASVVPVESVSSFKSVNGRTSFKGTFAPATPRGEPSNGDEGAPRKRAVSFTKEPAEQTEAEQRHAKQEKTDRKSSVCVIL
jgi:hypothetical protein